MLIHLFGATSSVGLALQLIANKQGSDFTFIPYSRVIPVSVEGDYAFDFNSPIAFEPAGEIGAPSIWINFAPIWLFATFFDFISRSRPEFLHGLNGLIACSSSSAITKRFSANSFDRELVERLTSAEDQLLQACGLLHVPCTILQPSMIYGQVGSLGDRNISRLIQLMRRAPCLPLPAQSGLRQPIHASQLAAVTLHLAEHMVVAPRDFSLLQRIALGGDSTLSYAEMMRALQQAQPAGDAARHCRLLPLPNRLFFSLATPLLLRSPKAFEAVLRMGANLSGFTPAHQLLGREPQPFPLLPLA